MCCAAAVAASGWLTSCSTFDIGRYANFIGPKGQAAPGSVPGGGAASRRARPATQPAGGPLRLNAQEAILLALENNRDLAVQRLAPPIRATYEADQRAAFDPVLSGQVFTRRSKITRGSRAGSGTESSISDTPGGQVGLDTFLPTGTSVSLGASSDILDSSLYANPLVSTRLGMTVTQALLQGAGLEVNLANLRQARIDTRVSEYELRGFAEALVADIEQTYWDHAQAKREIEISEDSLRLAEKQLEETRERIRVGKLAETELAAAQAEVALRKEGLIAAKSDLEKLRLRLLRQLNPSGPNLWSREIIFRDLPTVPQIEPEDVDQHVQVAMRMRPDLNQARLGVQRGDLELVKTRNGLLPKLDLFITLGKTFYATSFSHSIKEPSQEGYDVQVGASLSYPPINRQARADHRRAALTREQLVKAVENLEQLVQVDVRTAFIDMQRAREEIAATAATRALQEEKARVEAEKLRLGKSTSILVAAAQRDLLASQIAEVRALTGYLKAIVNLYLMEGSLLERRGISAPGREPATMAPSRPKE